MLALVSELVNWVETGFKPTVWSESIPLINLINFGNSLCPD